MLTIVIMSHSLKFFLKKMKPSRLELFATEMVKKKESLSVSLTSELSVNRNINTALGYVNIYSKS